MLDKLSVLVREVDEDGSFGVIGYHDGGVRGALHVYPAGSAPWSFLERLAKLAKNGN
jgi:hypothetical protein